MTNPNDRDPFAENESAPAVSFKDSPIGTVRTITVTEPANMAQGSEFGTGDKLYWVPGQRGKKSTTPSDQPVMCAVVNGTDENGEPCTVWAQKPSSMYSAIAAAQKSIKAGYRLKPGDKLHIRLTNREDSGKGNPRNVFAAKIEPAPEPDAFGGDSDPWGTAPASSAPAAQQADAADMPPW